MGTSNKPTEFSELQWRAFCYIGGELSHEEASEFEDVLAESQEAREAVAAAVEMSQEISVAHQWEVGNRSVELKRDKRAPQRVLGRSVSARWVSPPWLVLGVVAVIAFVWVGYSAVQRTITNYPQENRTLRNLTVDSPKEEANEALALEWSTTRQELRGEVTNDDLVESLDEVVAANPELEAPSWMLAALAQTADEEFDMEATP